MKHLAVIGIFVFAFIVLGALGFIGWNFYTFAQDNGMYGRGTMQAMMRERIGDSANSNSPAFVPTQRGMGMMNGRGGSAPTDRMANCPCMNDDTTSPQTAPSNNPAPTVAPTPQAGAGSSAASSTASTASSSSSSIASPKPGFSGKAGNLNVTLSMNPQPAAFSSTKFDITITDDKGAAVSDANVSLDLTMPSMFMPSNKPQAQSLGDGKYQATGRFTMRGGWRINVIIDRGGQKQNVYFYINL